MMRIWVSIFFALMLTSCGGSPARPAPIILRPSTTAELIAAARTAETQPNTTIQLTKGGRYILPDTLFIRGTGTTLDLNGTTLAHNAHYDSEHPTGMAAVIVSPILAKPVAWTGQTDSIWCNDPGAVGLLEVARGGKIPASGFAEPAPMQYPGKLRAAYGKARKIITPATNITIKNGTITPIDGGAYQAVNVWWAAKVKIDGIVVTGKWFFGPGQIGIQESEHVEVSNVSGCTVPVNSSTYITVRDSTIPGGISGEEMTRFLTVTRVTAPNIRSNDLLCDNWTFTNCTFTQPNWNPGTLQLWEHGDNMIFRNNTMASGGWSGGSGSVVLERNTGEGFTVYADPSKVVQTQNSWNFPSPVSPVNP